MSAMLKDNVVKLPTSMHPDNARFLRNERIGLKLIDAGVPVCLVSGENKKAIWKRFHLLDTAIPPAELARAKAEHEKKFGRDSLIRPFVCGATLDSKKFKNAIRKNRNCVPGIAMGPAGLICIDADQKHRGPDLLTAFYDENGGFGAETVKTPTQTIPGFHTWYRNTQDFPTSEALKNLGTDVKAVDSQCLAPGVLFKNGKSYGQEADCDRLVAAIKNGSLPTLPDFVVAKLRAHAVRERNAVNVDINKEAERLEKLVWPEYDELFDELYDLDRLKRNDTVLASILDRTYADNNPQKDTSLSTLRFLAAQALLREWPKMPVEHLIVFNEHFNGEEDDSLFGAYGEPVAGESYDLRGAIRCRENGLAGVRNGTAQAKVANGDLFGADGPEDIGQADEDAGEQPLKAAAPMGLTWGRDKVANWQPMRWAVRDIFPARGVSMIYAPSNTGKSFIALDVAQHIARGRSWCGKRVRQADVAYVYAEGGDGLSSRLKAWDDHNDTSGGDVAFFDDVPNLNKNPQRAVRSLVATAQGMKEHTGQKFGCIIFDTWSAVVAGADQNGGPNLSVIIEAVQWLAKQLDCLVLLIHHAGKDQSRGARGSTELPASVDTIHTLKVESGGITMHCEKSRDGSKGEPLRLRLKTVEVGVDEYGDVVTSCVVVPHNVGEGVNLDTAELPEDDLPEIVATDTTADRKRMIVKVMADASNANLADDERPGSSNMPMKAAEIRIAVNRERKAVGLPELIAPKMSAYLNQLSDDGLISKSEGTRPSYSLPKRAKN